MTMDSDLLEGGPHEPEEPIYVYVDLSALIARLLWLEAQLRAERRDRAEDVFLPPTVVEAGGNND